MKSRHFVFLWLTVVVVMAGYGIFIPIIAYLSNSGKVAINLASLILSAFALGQLISSPLMGHLADRIGSKNTLLIGLIGYSLSLTLTLISSSIAIVLLLRLASGLFAGAGVSSVEIYISKMSDEALKAKFFTLTSIAIGVGMTVGPILGLIYLFAPTGITIGLFIVLILITLIIYGFVIADTSSSLEPGHVQDSFKIRLAKAIKKKPNRFALTTCFVFGLITSSLEAIGLLYLINFFHLTKLVVIGVSIGLLLSFGYVVLISPYIINHTNNIKSAVLLHLIIALGLIMITIINHQSIMITGVFFIILAMSTLITTITVLVTKSNRQAGMVLGLRNSTLNIGSILGPIIASGLYVLNPQYTFYFLAIVCVGGAIYGFTIFERKQDE